MQDTPHSISERMDGSQDLREREKELDYVYSLALLLSAAGLDEFQVASQTADLFRIAMTWPELACVKVGITGINDTSVTSPSTSATQADTGASCPGVQGKALRASAGESEGCWLEAWYPGGGMLFSERELALAQSTVRLLAISAERMIAERQDTALKLDLERKNAALSELLSRIELEKKGIRDSIAARLMDRVLPLLARFDKTRLPAEWTAEIRRELVKSVEGTSSGGLSLRSLLSNRELDICALVADGLSSKEIADQLSLAVATVERHRHNARRKLGLPARQGSLGSINLENDL